GAGVDQAQPVDWDPAVLLRLARLQSGEQLGLRTKRPVAPNPVDCPVPRRCQQPGARAFGRAGERPPLERDRNGVLKGVLGEVEVAEDADQAREHPPPLGAKDSFELAQCSTTGRTSIAPPFRAAGIFEANSIASSMFPHSTR